MGVGFGSGHPLPPLDGSVDIKRVQFDGITTPICALCSEDGCAATHKRVKHDDVPLGGVEDRVGNEGDGLHN